MATRGTPTKLIKLHSFAHRQFDDPKYGGTRIENLSKQLFEDKVNEYFNERYKIEKEFGDRPALIDGYAPFCKHLFIPNFVDARVGQLEITDETKPLLQSDYEARTERELPVLVRYFDVKSLGGKDQVPIAKYLDLILYSREQLYKEAEATGRGDEFQQDEPWGLISVKAQNEAYETPMQPITIMRNELISQGGSGVPIQAEAYMKSVEYWRKHATIKW